MDWKKKRRTRRLIVLCIPILAAFLLLFVLHARHSVDQQSLNAVRSAVLQSAAQCYAVEGIYPSSLQYLEEHYGLVLNHQRYIIAYDAFSSNLPPDVTVLVRGEEGLS